jgi:excisionase family DNA binding protein
MHYYSTREAAKKLGIPNSTLAKYVAAGKVPGPRADVSGITTTRLWTEEEIEYVRKLLPKIANGRKTRYQKLREKQKAQARVPVPHKQRKPKNKK